MMWRTHSCVPRRDSSRRLVLNLYHRQASVETSLCQYRDILYDAARTSACATVRQRMEEAEDEFERARR